jgi:endonuclease III
MNAENKTLTNTIIDLLISMKTNKIKVGDYAITLVESKRETIDPVKFFDLVGIDNLLRSCSISNSKASELIGRSTIRKISRSSHFRTLRIVMDSSKENEKTNFEMVLSKNENTT